MRALASYIMRGRMQAMLVATALMALSLLFPVLSYVSGATVALVALRLGAIEALRVAAVALLGTVAIAWIALQQPAVGVVFAVVVWLPVMVLALLLRSTRSWATTLNVAAAVGLVAVVGVYLFVDNPAEWWRASVVDALQEQVVDRAGLSAEQADFWRQTLDQMANVMTGIVAAAFVFSAVLSLLLARWWQAQLYNPGGFRAEFHALQLGRPLAIVALVLLTASVLPMAAVSAIARDMAMVVLLLYLLQGLAVVHAIVARRGASVAWLVAVYVLLMIAMPQVVMILGFTGLMDTWLNLRRIAQTAKS